MKQLTMQDLQNLIVKLLAKGYNLKDIPVYIGNDDELNGIHMACYEELLDTKANDEDTLYYLEMINEDSHNIELKDKGVLIS